MCKEIGKDVRSYYMEKIKTKSKEKEKKKAKRGLPKAVRMFEVCGMAAFNK